MNNLSDKKHFVFVYGTLKKGYGNNRLLTNAEFVGNFATEPNYRIFCNGSFPYLIQVGEGSGVSVEGEIYKVSDQELARCDRLEGHPEMYERKPVAIKYEIKNDELVKTTLPSIVGKIEAYIYPHDVSRCRRCNTCWPTDRIAKENLQEAV